MKNINNEKIKSITKDAITIILTMAITFLFSKYIVGITVVCGDSMNDTYKNTQLLLTNKLNKDPERFEVLVFDHDGEALIKRVIGLPGETIRIDSEGNIYINDEILSENYGKAPIKDPGRALNDITLENNEYFVLGDNRNNSLDSRTEMINNITKENIIGTIFFSK